MSTSVPFKPQHGQKKRDPRLIARDQIKSGHSRSYESGLPQNEARAAFAHKDKRREDAKLRSEARAKRSPEEQLRFLNENDQCGTAKKERSRLEALIADTSKKEEPKTDTESVSETAKPRKIIRKPFGK